MKSPTKISAGPEDGPEEGEIVSDDLEDISDESIVFTPSIGKCLSHSDNLHALSLSSVTEVDEPPKEKRTKRRKSYSQRHVRREKKRKKTIVDSDSSDNDTTLDRRLKLQLKAAVRVDVEEAHRNSLRTRLRAMVNGDSVEAKQKIEENGLCITEDLPSPSITVIDLVEQDANSSCIEILASSSENAASAPENNDSSSEIAKVDDVDNELIHLRIEALKTAINNKFANRRKKKKESTELKSSDDTNKENTSNNSKENQNTKTSQDENKTEQPQASPQTVGQAEINAPNSPEEDEDVMRALLLASISKKITKIHPESSHLALNEIQTTMSLINQNKVKNNNNFRQNNHVHTVHRVLHNGKKVGATKLIRVPQVKPLIINLNSDSESDWEFSSSPEKSPKKTQNNANGQGDGKIAKNLEAVIDNPSIKPKNDGDNNIICSNFIESNVEKFLREQRAKVESELLLASKNVNVVSNDKLLENKKVVIKAQVAEKAAPGVRKVNPRVNLKTTPIKPKVQKMAEVEKSALKFLPASKREEYKKLQNLLKLKKAQLKKPKVRRISQKISENSNNLKITVMNKNDIPTNSQAKSHETNIAPKKLPQNKITHTLVKTNNSSLSLSKAKQNNAFKKVVHTRSTQTLESEHIRLPPQIEARLKEFGNQEHKAAKIQQDRRRESMMMRSNLKQLQTKEDGRLQIQERYKSLRPLVKKLNEVSKEQKLCDQEAERLLAELKQAREKQESLYRNMLASIKELTEEKRKIDLSLLKEVVKSKPNAPITSTPIKPGSATAPITLLTSGISYTHSNDIIPNQSPIVLQKGGEAVKEPEAIMMNTWEQSTICNNRVQAHSNTDEAEITVVDPNDIDNIIKKTEERIAILERKQSFECRKSAKVRYVSPLDPGRRRDALDPFGIMCPFEVNGTCKDPDCEFNHLPK